jgi:hypothetical protein
MTQNILNIEIINRHHVRPKKDPASDPYAVLNHTEKKCLVQRWRKNNSDFFPLPEFESAHQINQDTLITQQYDDTNSIENIPQEFQNAVIDKMFINLLPWQILTAVKNSNFLHHTTSSVVHFFHLPNRVLVVPSFLYSLESHRVLDKHIIKDQKNDSIPLALILRYNTGKSAHERLQDHIKDQSVMHIIESLIRRKNTMKNAQFNLPSINDF